MHIDPKTCELNFMLFLRNNEDEKSIAFTCNPTKNELVSLTKETNGIAKLEKIDDDIYAKYTATIFPEIQCERCLKKVSKQEKITLERLYTEKPEIEDLIEKEMPKNFKIPILDEILEEYIAGTVYQKLCKKKCKGLCTQCGKNLNTNPEHTH